VGGVLLALAMKLLRVQGPLWPALLVVVGCVFVCAGLHCGRRAAESERDSLQVKVGQLQQELGAAAVSVSNLQLGVEEQNRGVELLRRETELQQERAEVAEARAQRVKVVYQDRIVKVQQAAVPSDCEGAVRWGAEQAAAAAAEWRKGARHDLPGLRRKPEEGDE
jgi:hypothetical protein